jgi:hypothetical protein
VILDASCETAVLAHITSPDPAAACAALLFAAGLARDAADGGGGGGIGGVAARAREALLRPEVLMGLVGRLAAADAGEAAAVAGWWT